MSINGISVPAQRFGRPISDRIRNVGNPKLITDRVFLLHSNQRDALMDCIPSYFDKETENPAVYMSKYWVGSKPIWPFGIILGIFRFVTIALPRIRSPLKFSSRWICLYFSRRCVYRCSNVWPTPPSFDYRTIDVEKI